MTRKILHIDMDAFYAQVEQRDFPQYRHKPLVVGSSDPRGVVAAASYEARKFGIHSAMPSSVAKKKCAHLIFAPPRFDVYRTISKKIHAIFKQYTHLIEPLSLDEAYLDVTHNHINEPSATRLAEKIQREIFDTLNLTASVGISYNKFLAKIASNINKPFGTYVITPQQALSFLDTLPIEKFYGIGLQTTKKMHALGIHNGQELKNRTRAELKLHFGKAGDLYYLFARGEDQRAVNPDQTSKSIGAENTFNTNLSTIDEINLELHNIISTLIVRLNQHNFHGQTLAIKVRHGDFNTFTRSKTFSTPIPHDMPFITAQFWELFQSIPKQPIRLLGITVQGEVKHYHLQTTLDFEQ